MMNRMLLILVLFEVDSDGRRFSNGIKGASDGLRGVGRGLRGFDTIRELSPASNILLILLRIQTIFRIGTLA